MKGYARQRCSLINTPVPTLTQNPPFRSAPGEVMNLVIARTRSEVGRLLTSADGIKCCKIITLGVKTAYFCL